MSHPLRNLLLVAALLASAPMPAFAGSTDDASQQEAESARAMDVLHLPAPVVRNGKLVAYLFVSARIHLGERTDIWRARDKGHFVRDALLRAIHRRSLAAAGRDDQVDTAAAAALIAEVTRQVLGPDSVKRVDILGVSQLRVAQSRVG